MGTGLFGAIFSWFLHASKKRDQNKALKQVNINPFETSLPPIESPVA